MRRLRQIDIEPADWEAVTLPSHLEITFRVRSERGAVLDEGPSITELQRRLAPQTRSAVESVVKGAVAQALDEARAQLLRQGSSGGAPEASTKHPASDGGSVPSALAGGTRAERAPDHTWNVPDADNLETWPDTLPELPDVVESQGPRGMTVRGYPAFVEVPAAGDVNVALRVLAEPAEQVRDHRRGVIRLLAIDLALPESRITSRWSGEEARRRTTPHPEHRGPWMTSSLRNPRYCRRWAKSTANPLGRMRTRTAYEELRTHARQHLEEEVYRLVKTAVRVLQAYGRLMHSFGSPHRWH